MLRGWRADKRISEAWVLPETPRVWRALLSFWVSVHGLKVLLWKEVATTEV